MKVNLKCFGHLARDYEGGYREKKVLEFSGDVSVSEVIDATGIDEDDVKIVFVDHRISKKNQPLQDGSQVTLVPHTGGM